MIDVEKVKLLNKYRNENYNAPLGTIENQIANALNNVLPELDRLQKKETPMKPKVSIVYDNDGKHARANCSVCGAMVYQTCGLYPLKVALGGERPYCQHCGQHLSDDIDMNENHYCECV